MIEYLHKKLIWKLMDRRYHMEDSFGLLSTHHLRSVELQEQLWMIWNYVMLGEIYPVFEELHKSAIHNN